MINNKAANNRKVLVELSPILMGGNGQNTDEIPSIFNIEEKTGMFYERAHNTICIEGEWDEISEFIHQCYNRIQAHSPQGFLKVSIR